MRPLTKNQNRVHGFICGYIEGSALKGKQEPPTVREIQEGLGFKHIKSVQSALRGLEDRRYIERKPRRWRNIVVIVDY